MDMEELIFKKADIKNIEKMLDIIHRCLREVNYVDFTKCGLNDALSYFNQVWLTNIIETRHYYEVWCGVRIILLHVVESVKT